MATFDFLLDTNPMAATMVSVGKHVTGTTAAVTAMEAAVIESEKEAADRICENVDRGFFYLIRSQVTAKRAKSLSELNARIMTLAELGKALRAQKDRMDSDVSRLKREYYKIFHAMDVALERRIAELDRDAVRLGEARKSLITDKMLKSTAEAITYDKESSATVRMAQTGRLKKYTSRALQNVGNNIDESKDYRDQLAGILGKKTHNAPVRECIPVMFYEQKSLTSADSAVTRVLSPDDLDQGSRSTIETRMMQNMQMISSVRHNEYEKSMIRQAFGMLSEREIKDQRVKQIAQYLFDRGGLL